MRRVIIRYKVKPERVAEHETLLRAVFDELERTKPEGLRYGAFKQADGVSFVHVAFMTAEKNPLEGVAAFKAFTSGVKERCDESPVTAELTELGLFGL